MGIKKRLLKKTTSKQERDVVHCLSRDDIFLRQLTKQDNIPVTKSTLSRSVKYPSKMWPKKEISDYAES